MGLFYSYADKDGLVRYHNNWYDDPSHFVDYNNPWFARGGNHDNGVLAGQFYFARTPGDFYIQGGFRLVLTP